MHIGSGYNLFSCILLIFSNCDKVFSSRPDNICGAISKFLYFFTLINAQDPPIDVDFSIIITSFVLSALLNASYKQKGLLPTITVLMIEPLEDY